LLLSLLILNVLLSLRCHPSSKRGSLAGGQRHSEAATPLQYVPEVSPSKGVDVSRLRVDGPEERVLVRSRGRVFIRSREYHAWLGSYPLNITSEDPAKARREALEQMVTFKLILQQAREGGYAEKLGFAGKEPTDKSLVLTYIRDQVMNLSLITDKQAQEYLAGHKAMFTQLNTSNVPEEVKMMVAKRAVRGEQLWEQVKTWMERARLSYEGIP